jgi:NAD(P)H-hydrate repair Nnr-like enzyme with NAD(P)H-hydrate epimerase domain
VIQAYAVADVRAVEAALMEHLPEGELMARAANGLAEVVRARLAERGGHRVVALVGGGNNGGDALYAAALLAQAGFAVGAVCTAYGSVHPGGRDAALAAGVVVTGGDGPDWEAVLAEADIVVDGITGIGGRPGPERRGPRLGRGGPRDGLRRRGRPAQRPRPGWRGRHRRVRVR